MLKHLGWWPTSEWHRDLAFRIISDNMNFTFPTPETLEQDVFHGISEQQIRGLILSKIGRKIRAQSMYFVHNMADGTEYAIYNPALRALGGKKDGGIGGLDGKGIKIGIIGNSWDCEHKSFAQTKFLSIGKSVAMDASESELISEEMDEASYWRAI